MVSFPSTRAAKANSPTQPQRNNLLPWLGSMICCALCIGNLFAQEGSSSSRARMRTGDPQEKVIKVKGQNLPNYDDRKIHYGFFLALNSSRFRTKPSQYFVDQLRDTASWSNETTLKAINPQSSLGFTTGFVFNRRLHQFIDLRLLPSVSFFGRTVNYTYINDSTISELAQSTFSFVELPLMVRYKSVRRNNTRMYVTAGIKPCFEVGARRKEVNNDRLRSRPFDLTIDYGFGFDLYYPLFKFSPELRFSHGIVNIRQKDPNPFSQSLKRLYTHTVTLFFNFE